MLGIFKLPLGSFLCGANVFVIVWEVYRCDWSRYGETEYVSGKKAKIIGYLLVTAVTTVTFDFRDLFILDF